MYVKDLDGREYAVMATFLIEDELNGNVKFSAVLEPNKPNLLFLNKIEKMWRIVDNDGTEYIIVYTKKKGKGEMSSVEIKAIPKFFDDFDNDRVYEEYNQSLTAKASLDIIFGGSGYNYILNGDFGAIEWEGFGNGNTRLKMFQDWLNRYNAEFEPPVGNTIYIYNQVGEDLNVMYRHRLNASNIIQEVDATSLWTYAKGYGDYGESDEEGETGGNWQDAKLIREYTSPLAKLIGIRHAPPIKDGRIKIASTMDKRLKKLVDESLKISVTADIHDLTRQGYPISQTKNGDRVFLIDERIGLNEEVRVVNRKILRNWKNEIINIELTFGSQSIVKRHQSKMSNATKAINEVLEGRRKIPFNALSNEVAVVTKAILSAQTELQFENGIIARDPTNPNLLVVLNSAGLGISQDGGRTFKNAITGRGILAEHILAGTITAGANKRIDIADGSIWSYFGDKLTMNFGQYSLDFYHTDGTLIGSFGRGYIPMSSGGDYYRGLNLLVADSFFDIIHLKGGVRNFAFRTASFNSDNNYTALAGPRQIAGKSFLGLYTDAEIWKNNRRTDQASMVFEQKLTEHNVYIYYGGRNESGGRKKGALSIIYNDSNDTSQLVAQAYQDLFYTKKLQVLSDITTSGPLSFLQGGFVRCTSNSIRLGVSDGTYIYINDKGQVGFVHNGTIYKSFDPT